MNYRGNKLFNRTVVTSNIKLYKRPLSLIASSVFLLCLFRPYTVYAQVNWNVKESKIDNIFRQWEKPHSPGCAVGVYHGGKIIFAKGYGGANLKNNVSITPKTDFFMASVSKEFTAAAVALLAIRGKIDLRKPVRYYLPKLPTYPGHQQPTVWQLLHHTSGVTDFLNLFSLYDVNVKEMDFKKIIEIIEGQSHLNFEPGSRYLYSNSGYSLLAAIVQHVSGQPFKKFTLENIFEPLGMMSTIFREDRNRKIKNQALAYRRKPNGKFKMSYLKDFVGVGPGGLHTNIEALAKWNQQLSQNQLPDAKGFNKLMLQRGVLNNGDTLNYAFGLVIRKYKGQRTVSHDGSYMGFKASFFRVPKANYGSAVLCNDGNIDPGKLNREVADLYLKTSIEKWMKEFTGKYYSKALNLEYTFKEYNGNLYLIKKKGARKHRLTFVVAPYGTQRKENSEFHVGRWEITFKKSYTGKVEGFIISDGRTNNIFFKKE
jgi:CubicO group peptidase (beta-lactamase class C family)